MRVHPVSVLSALVFLSSIFFSANAQETATAQTPLLDSAEPQSPSLLLPVLESPADPGGFFFAAEKLKIKSPKDDSVRASMEFMYTLAFRFARGPAAKEAGRALVSLLRDAQRLQDAARMARDYLEAFGSEWEMYRTLYDVLSTAGAYRDALSLIPELRKALPAVEKSRSTELAWMEYASRSALGDWSWVEAARTYLRSASADSYSRSILRLIAAAPDFPADQASLALFRANAQEGKYAEALAYARPILPAFSRPDAPRIWLSELGKTFFGASAFDEGIGFFASALGFAGDSAQKSGTAFSIQIDRKSIHSENKWVMAYHMARLFQGRNDPQTAAGMFIELTPLAFSPQDADSALWYWLDITMKSISAGTLTMEALTNAETPAETAGRPLELAALSQAAALWKNPSFFEDIAAQYMRRLLREQAWDDVVRLTILMGRRLTPSMRGPLLYLSGRLIETGRASSDISADNEFRQYLENGTAASAAANAVAAMAVPADGTSASSTDIPPALRIARLFYSTLLRETGIEEHYRTMAAWRLGMDPPLLSRVPELGKDYQVTEEIARRLPSADSPPVSDATLSEVLTFIEQSLEYGLDVLAAGQVGSLSIYSPDSLLWMAKTFAEHEQYYPALRIGSEMLRRPLQNSGQDTVDIGYALLYPKAWNGHFREITEANRIEEPLAYAVVRSESMFNQRAVSRSGAVGLSQLLPSTASETARGLRMESFNLTDPRDNLRIGMAYFGYMLRRFGERPARAMAAYNAGPSRMMQWAGDWGSLEDDILIELYPLSEPRQYTKNIIAAALHYGKLYYGIRSGDMLAFLLEGKPLPKNGQGEISLSLPSSTP